MAFMTLFFSRVYNNKETKTKDFSCLHICLNTCIIDIIRININYDTEFKNLIAYSDVDIDSEIE